MTAGITPLGALVRGAVAGGAGTAAMDLVRYVRYRRGGGDDGPVHWELASTPADFAAAGPPAQVGKRLVEGLFDTKMDDDLAPITNNVVHWATGMQWGALYGLVAGSRAAPRPALGLVLGPIAWGTAYAVLGAAGLYRPIWEYDLATLRKDLGAHVVFGVVTGTAFRVLHRRGR